MSKYVRAALLCAALVAGCGVNLLGKSGTGTPCPVKAPQFTGQSATDSGSAPGPGQKECVQR